MANNYLNKDSKYCIEINFLYYLQYLWELLTEFSERNRKELSDLKEET
jgi:hypothetical protein